VKKHRHLATTTKQQFYLNMELHTKQLQIGVNSVAAAQLCPHRNAFRGPLMVFYKKRISKALLY